MPGPEIASPAGIAYLLGPMKTSSSSLREERGRLPSTPYPLFGRWFEKARTAPRPDWLDTAAMVLTTVSGRGAPSARVVLCRAHSARGVVFFTSYRSRKAVEIDATGLGAVVFHWPHLKRQVRMEGRFERVSAVVSDRYFASRPRSHQIGAWASHQSQPLKTAGELVERQQVEEARYEGKSVPRPPWWGGYRLVPMAVEFWQQGAGRLHERILYRRCGQTWTRERLNP